MRHFKKRVLALLLAGAVGIGNYASVSASAIKDAQDKKDEAQQELNQVNQQIQNIQSAQNSLQAEMNNYDNQWRPVLFDGVSRRGQHYGSFEPGGICLGRLPV